jgi:hypothetical protein
MASFMLELLRGRLCYHGHCTNRLKALGIIFQSIDGSTCIVDCATMGIGGLIPIEKGFWDVVEQLGGVMGQLRDVLELFLLDT